MEWILESDNNHNVEKVLALARELGIRVTQKDEISKRNQIAPPQGKNVSPEELLEFFGQAPDFPSAEEIRSKTWLSSW